MTTNIQLREWLSRFPDDALINVLVSEKDNRRWETSISAHVVPVTLPDVKTEQLTWQECLVERSDD